MHACSPAAVRLDRWKKKVEAVQHELPEVRGRVG
jgi:hypothetical protein